MTSQQSNPTNTNTYTTELISLWYRIFEDPSFPPRLSAAKVKLQRTDKIVDFCEAVRDECPNILRNVDVRNLVVYKTQTSFDNNEEPLSGNVGIFGYGLNMKEALLVVVSDPTIQTFLSLTLPPPSHISETLKSRIRPHYSFAARDPLKFDIWSSFDAEVCTFIQSIDTEKRVKKTKAPILVDDHIRIYSQRDVSFFVFINVARFLGKLDGNFSEWNYYSSPDFLGRPDFGFVDNNGDRLLLVMEVLCPWETGHDADLFDSTNEKTQHIISHLKGYLDLNGISYGVLSTYTHWWFFKKTTDDNLLISHCHTYDSLRPTILECVYYMISLGRAAPQRQPLNTREVSVTFENGGMKRVIFEERLLEGNSCDVWRISLLPERRDGIFKMVDAKHGIERLRIDREAENYQILQSLQGRYIPEFEGKGMIGNAFYGFITSYDGEPAQGKLTDAEKERVKLIVSEMHKLGVAHGDLRFPNIVRNADGLIKLIDFGSAKTSCNEYQKYDMQRLKELFEEEQD